MHHLRAVQAQRSASQIRGGNEAPNALLVVDGIIERATSIVVHNHHDPAVRIISQCLGISRQRVRVQGSTSVGVINGSAPSKPIDATQSELFAVGRKTARHRGSCGSYGQNASVRAVALIQELKPSESGHLIVYEL